MKYLFFIIFLIFFNNFVYAKDLFETSLYNIEFTSKNIEKDKINEIKKIKFKSILSIFEKTLNNQYYNELSFILSEDLINTFIKNIIINDEKIIENKYISKIKINFDKIKIVDFFRQKQIPYVEFYPDKFLLILYEKNKLNENLFSKNNHFYNYYNTKVKKNNLFKIPDMDINDRFILQKEHIENREFENIYKISNKYNSKETIIVIATKLKNKIDNDLILISDKKIYEKKFILNETDLNNFFITLEKESLMMWKEINQIQNISANSIKCRINYFNILELKQIKYNFNNISILSKLNIKTLSYKSVEYDIEYFGNKKILFNLFKLNNLKISEKDDLCIIRLI
tara:strand:+ start:458 stop:1483 length:1026 start_codon:yes stop_codon:yes gene_type:complete